MRLDSNLVEARFIRRLNRFAAVVELEGVETEVHVANSGRMRELLVEGNRVLLRPAARNGRKTSFDLALVDLGHNLSSADARLPNVLVHEALGKEGIPPLSGYTSVRREVTFGESRLDMILEGPVGKCFVETKSVTLVVDGVALFPDAPTTRGVKHLYSLCKAISEGYRAAVVFVVQREDATAFAPNDEADPDFGGALRYAVGQGVEVYAYRCKVSTEEIRLTERLSVRLSSRKSSMARRPATKEDSRAPTESFEPLIEIYHRLFQWYGPQHWWPGESPFEIVIGAILTQGTAWANVERALNNLKTADCFSSKTLLEVSEEELAILLRPSGYFNAKARKLKAFINHLWEEYEGELDMLLAKEGNELRQELLSIYGIGEETADDIVLYAAEQPSFVIDAYTRRILQRLGLSPKEGSYGAYQEVFHGALPPESSLYNEYHALLDRHAKETCKKEPLCEGCCLLEMCPTGQSKVQSLPSQVP